MRQGGIVTKEASMDISKVQLMCPKCNKPARVKYTLLDDGKKVRICNKCNEMVDQ
jgi:large subunit ribosomal protein L24